MGKCSALQSQWWLWQQLGARCGGRKSRLCLLGLSPHPVSLCSWGPDDDGKTVDGPHQLGKVNPSSSSPGGASRACGLLPARSGREGRGCDILHVCVCPLVPAEVSLSPWGWERPGCSRRAACRRGRAGQGELSKERLLPAGKGSFTTCGRCGTGSLCSPWVLSAQEFELSLCSGWLSRQGWCLWILAENKGEEESELRLLLPRPLRFSQSSCAAELLQNTPSLPVLQRGVTKGPQSQQWGVVLLQCFSSHSSAALTAELFVHHNKWFPVLQVNLFPSCLHRQLEQAPGHKAQAELAVPQRMGRMCPHLPGEGEQGAHFQRGCALAHLSDVSFP